MFIFLYYVGNALVYGPILTILYLFISMHINRILAVYLLVLKKHILKE